MLAAALLLAASGAGPGAIALNGQVDQSQGPPPTNPHPRYPGDDSGPGNDLSPALQEKMLLAQNELRQKQLVADTKKLLTLAQELQAEVDKSNKNMLSVAVVKKAEEIEKLAHSVKEKMKAQ